MLRTSQIVYQTAPLTPVSYELLQGLSAAALKIGTQAFFFCTAHCVAPKGTGDDPVQFCLIRHNFIRECLDGTRGVI